MRTIQILKDIPEHHWLHSYSKYLFKKDLSKVSIRGYLYDINHFRLWMIETLKSELPLRSINNIDIATYRHYLYRIKEMKAASINRRLQALRNFFSWAFNEQLVKEDPTKEVRFVRTSPRIQPAALKEVEVYSLLREAGKSKHGLAKRNVAIIQMLVQTGIRISELAALKRRDLSLHERSGVVTIRGGKGLKERLIPLNSSVRRALSNYLKETKRNEEDILFCNNRGQPLSVRSIQHTIKIFVEKGKLNRIAVSAHTLRHTFASNYLKNNPGKLVELATLMGHDSLDTTAVYTRPSLASLIQDVERMPVNVY